MKKKYIYVYKHNISFKTNIVKNNSVLLFRNKKNNFIYFFLCKSNVSLYIRMK